ncbi:MAG: Asp-tRNA(Asn)/Glu-tRNA(Gln) amidotransferase subunit GatC [Ilumatobacteraceae bacterium]
MSTPPTGSNPARITSEVVAKVAKLASLQLSEAELELMTSQLSGMLDHFADIDKLNLSNVAPLAQPFPLKNVFREDVVVAGVDRDEVLAAAPAAQEGRFRVPPSSGLGEQ